MSGSRQLSCQKILIPFSLTALLVGVVIFAFFDYTSFIERIRSLSLPWPIAASAKFIIAWTVAFHTLNGIRFMVCRIILPSLLG